MEVVNLMLLLVVATIAVAAFFVSWSLKKITAMKNQVRQSNSKTENLKEELQNLKVNMGSLKNNLSRKDKELEEARLLNRKKRKKEAQLNQESTNKGISNMNISQSEEQSKQALKAMQSQLQSLKEDASAQKEALQDDISKEFDAKKNEMQKEIDTLKSQLKNHKKYRHDLEASIPVKINLEEIPKNAMYEVARFYRKANQYEKLYSMINGKLKLSQEKYNELQKRYFEVCRELAVATGKDDKTPDNNDSQEDVKEDTVAKEPAAIASKESEAI